LALEAILFYVLAATTVGASLLVIGQRNPVYSVMLLIASFGGLASLYVLLDAPFTAVTQIIIYAGAIMVLFLFVVMLLNVKHERQVVSALTDTVGARGRKIGAVLAALLAVEVLWALSRIGPTWFTQDAEATGVSSVARIGTVLFREHAFAFEATSILILVAMVGAVVLARRER
jgi:NADH-quinone oxidoreductase subunit J